MKKFGVFALSMASGICLTAVTSTSLMAQSVRTPVNLGSAGNFVILSKTGITDVPTSAIVGNIGASPITGAAIHVSCAEVTGTIYAVDAAGPAPCAVMNSSLLGTAIGNMATAYTDAAGRTIPDFVNLGAGNISGKTLAPGLYHWTTDVTSDNTGFTLSGGPNAVWIFQVAGNVNLANGAHVTLTGGAQATNIFWQIAGGSGLTLGTGAVFYGNALTATAVIMNTGASLTGRALAVTDVTLAMSPVTSPGTLIGGIPSVIPPTVTSTAPPNLGTNVPIGNALTATFSEAMNPTTITPLTFTLQNGLTPVLGTVSYIGVTATFTPSSNLPADTLLTATITTEAQDPQGDGLASNYVWTFTTGAAPDLTPPTVSSTVPANGAINVPIGNALSATFSEPMNPLTINTATFTLKQGATAVLGTVTYAGVTATFTPLSTLAPSLPFTATITTGVTDLSGNALAATYVWTFTTGAAPDLTPPTVSSTVPANGATNVPIGNALSATFSEAMNPLTINTATFTLKQGATAVLGTVTYAGVTATFTPLAALVPSLPFTATITTGVQDLSGNALAATYVWTFTTGAAPDLTPPTVSSTVPANGATNVPIGNALSATFDEAMNPLTINTATFTLKQGATAVLGTVTYAGVTATFTPLANLAPSLPFTATITTGVTDLAGNALVSNYVWSFTTGATPDLTPPTVSSTVPANGATNVPIGNALSATFDEAMNPLTISTATFTLKQGVTSVSGTVTYAGVTATFTPLGSLAADLPFTATIATGALDLAGNALVANYVWTFTTGAAPDLTPPTVISTVPANGAPNVPVNFGMSATFSEAMNPLTISTATFKLMQGGTAVPGSVSYSGVTAVFSPLSALSPGVLFTATITTGVTDLAGNALVVNYVWTFTTAVPVGPPPVTITPSVISTLPVNGATIVPVGNALSANFSEAINPLTISTATFTLMQGSTPVPGTVSYSGVTAIFNPLSGLAPNLLYTATITTGVTDLAGNALISNYVWSFTTGSTLPGIDLLGTVNAASYVAPVAPGSIAAAFGTNLAIGQASSTASEPLPTTLAQSSFAIGGQAAPLFFATAFQVNMQIPWELAGQIQTSLVETVNGVVSNTQIVAIAAFAPGIFSVDASGAGQGAILIAPTAQLAAPGSAAPTGATVSIFCTGLGPVTNQPATGIAGPSGPLSMTLTTPVVTIGGVGAVVAYSGLAPTLVGVYQVNAVVPSGVSPGGAVPVVINIGNVASNTVTIAVQ
jgi:uncharacterized protein (TIGR03437 family)